MVILNIVVQLVACCVFLRDWEKYEPKIDTSNNEIGEGPVAGGYCLQIPNYISLVNIIVGFRAC